MQKSKSSSKQKKSSIWDTQSLNSVKKKEKYSTQCSNLLKTNKEIKMKWSSSNLTSKQTNLSSKPSKKLTKSNLTMCKILKTKTSLLRIKSSSLNKRLKVEQMSILLSLKSRVLPRSCLEKLKKRNTTSQTMSMSSAKQFSIKTSGILQPLLK